MIALVLAAVLQTQTPLLAIPDRCRETAQKVREGQREAFHKLGDLPLAKSEYAVMRKVDGCMVAAPMRFSPRGPQAGPRP